jgi:hypothetical protein
LPRSALVFAAILVAWPQAAQAEEPYYFYKAGTSREAYAEDVKHCAELAGGARFTGAQVRPTNPNAPYALEGAAIASLFIGFMQARERRRVLSRIERTCMADKGYQRRSIARPLYKELRSLQGAARIDRLFAMVSVEQPSGEVLVE